MPRRTVLIAISSLLTVAIMTVSRADRPLSTAAGSSSSIEFATSCDTAVAATFNRAVELLHSFEYPESENTFLLVLNTDPDCAMAHWGVAMNRWHPLWAPPSEADLEAGAGALARIDTAALTRREAAFIGALESFYGNYNSLNHAARAKAYSDRMQIVYKDTLDDPEAAVFYALSLLAAANPRDKSHASQVKAAGLLNRVRAEQPHHPGVLHYIIHSYDFPGLAHLALDAAEIYADVAPDSAHAQHMPSHIFTRLGLWEKSISSNHQSTRSATEYTRRAGLDGHYDEGLHSIDYLMYALLQTGRNDEARELLDELQAIGKTNTENFKVAYSYASAPARYALERRQWKQASQMPLKPDDFLWDQFPWARSIHHFARGIGAARSDQLAAASRELSTIREIAKSLPSATLPYWREQVFVQGDAVESWILLAVGDSEAALRLARAAADREDAVDKHPVTPGEVLPARELLADMLLQLDRPDAALEQYRIVLASSPKRANALLGAGKAAERAGQARAAAGYYKSLAEQTVRAGSKKIG